MAGDDVTPSQAESAASKEPQQPLKKVKLCAFPAKSAGFTSTQPTPAPTVSKKDRKRFKKVPKKAARREAFREASGLLTKAECQEYRNLIASEGAGDKTQTASLKGDAKNASATAQQTKILPSIHFRAKKRHVRAKKRESLPVVEKTEGTHHRNLIAWILKHIQKDQQKGGDAANNTVKKKRHRGSSSNSYNKDTLNLCKIPHFCSLHNPGAVEQLAVLQVQIPKLSTTSDNNENPLEPFIHVLKDLATKEAPPASTSESQQSTTSHSNIGLRTKWFQGHVPKGMSESLLYYHNSSDDNNNDSKKKAKIDKTATMTRQEMLKRMESLLLSKENMIRHGYPQALPTQASNGTAENESSIRFIRLKTISDPITTISTDDDANKFVEQFGVHVLDQDEDDDQLYVETQGDDSNNNNQSDHPVRVFGLDCEMVLTQLGQELARVTLLEFQEFVIPSESGGKKHDFSSSTTIVMDCLVKPNNPVVDYLTKHSGITATMLEPVTTTLAHVQYTLAHYLTSKDILVGHSLENDLKALHYIHPRVIDTAVLFQRSSHNPRAKHSLRHLSAHLLKRTIQTGSHCSEEDAKATLDLALKKAWLGDELRTPGSSDAERTSILTPLCPKLANASNNGSGGSGGAVFIGPSGWLEAHVTSHQSVSAHALSYDSIGDCQKAMLSWMSGRRKAQLVWTHVSMPKDKPLDDTVNAFKSLIEESLVKLPKTCILMVALQHGLEDAQAAFKQRRICQDARSTVGWSETKEAVWQEELEATRFGFIQWYAH